MQDSAERDQLVMSIVSNARQHPPEKREDYVRSACGDDSTLYEEVTEALQWEDRMGLFLQEPLLEGTQIRPFYAGDVVLDRFEILREIGEGGMSFVYEAFDRRRHQRIAIKAAKPGFQRLLSPELEGALAVRHHNVCLVNEIHIAPTVNGEIDFLTMELLEGKTLAAHLFEEGRLPPAKAREVALQLCAGLAEAHRSGVIHRDLKSGNVMLCAEDDGSCRAVIMDFGLASGETFFSPDDGGTPGYMAPEVRRGEKASKESDIYSLGVVLYETITGRRPVEANLSEEDQAHGPSAPCDLVKGLDQRWDNAILPCLAVSPVERPVDATQVAARLRKRQIPKIALLVLGLLLSSLIGIILVLPGLRARALRYFGWDKSPSVISTIVLADFAGGESFADTLKTALGIQLEQSPSMSVLSDRKIGETLKLMNRAANQPLTPEVSREICLRTSSQILMEGSVIAVGQHYSLSVKALACETGNTLASAETEVASKEKLLQAVNRVGNQLREKLGESRESRERFNQPLEEATTSSLDALQAYTEGLKLQAHGGDPQAIAYFSRAIDLDQSFAGAHLALGSAYENMGQSTAAFDSYKKAYALRDKVSQRERLHIEASYYGSVTGELNKAVPIYVEWSQIYPNDWQPHQNLSLFYAELGEYEKAASEASIAIQQNPDTSFPYTTLMFALNAMDRPGEAISIFQRAQQRNLENASLGQYHYQASFLTKDDAGMMRDIAQAKGKAGAEDMLVSAQSDTEAYYGREAKARSLSQLATDIAKRAGTAETAALWKANAALREAEMGNRAEASEAAADALKISPGKMPETVAALVFARAGQLVKAQRMVDKLNSEFPLDTMMQYYCLPTIQSAIELEKHRPGRAVEILQATSPYELGSSTLGSLYPAYIRGEAYLQAGDGSRAALEFQKLIDHPGVMLNAVTGALAYLQLGRAQQMAGNKEGARKSYNTFLTLWKDATPDLPILKKAKAEYQQLAQ